MTKQELQEYYWLRRNILRLEHRIEELETMATKQTSRLKNNADARVAHGNYDRLGDTVAEIGDLETEIREQLRKSYEAATRIEKAIDDLPDREKYLVRARYIELKTWEQIAVDMGYSWRQVHNIHSLALQELA